MLVHEYVYGTCILHLFLVNHHNFILVSKVQCNFFFSLKIWHVFKVNDASKTNRLIAVVKPDSKSVIEVCKLKKKPLHGKVNPKKN